MGNTADDRLKPEKPPRKPADKDTLDAQSVGNTNRYAPTDKFGARHPACPREDD